jgi:hypothetical protein
LLPALWTGIVPRHSNTALLPRSPDRALVPRHSNTALPPAPRTGISPQVLKHRIASPLHRQGIVPRHTNKASGTVLRPRRSQTPHFFPLPRQALTPGAQTAHCSLCSPDRHSPQAHKQSTRRGVYSSRSPCTAYRPRLPDGINPRHSNTALLPRSTDRHCPPALKHRTAFLLHGQALVPRRTNKASGTVLEPVQNLEFWRCKRQNSTLPAPKEPENRDFCGLLTVKIHNLNRLLRPRRSQTPHISPAPRTGIVPGTQTPHCFPAPQTGH